MTVNLSSKLVSKLGSPDSRIPLAAKDIFNSAGYTYFSYDSGGSVEAKDRLLDEVGTGLIWLFGIPVYRKLIDKTVFKKAGISPEVDIRVLQNKDYFQKALENAPTEEIKSQLKKAGENIKLTRNLNLIKFGAALALTMASYFGLTKLKQYMTKKNIEKEFFKENGVYNDKYQNLKPANETAGVFAEFTNPNKSNPSFKGFAPIATATEFVLNPIKNMIILDAGISTQRIVSSRTKKEREEYAIKEGAFLFFVYGADKLIKKGINAFTEKVLKLPTALEAELLSSETAQTLLTDKNAAEKVNEFVNKFGKTENIQEIYDFIFANPEHTVTVAAKKSGIIPVLKDGKSIDSRKFIDPEKVKTFGNDLKKFIENGKLSGDTAKYLNKVKALKVVTTILNVAICCFALGYAVPKYIYSKRAKDAEGNGGFHVKNEYIKQLQAQKISDEKKPA